MAAAQSEKLLGLPVPANYKPSDGELDNIVYVVLKYTIGWPMRQVDKAVCIMMAGGADAIVGDAGISKLVMEACEYAWDHLSGKPDEFDADKLFEHIKPTLHKWYKNTTPAERAVTG